MAGPTYSDLDLVSQQSSFGDSYSYSYSSYYTDSEPDYIMLEIRIKQLADDVAHLQKTKNRLVEDLDLERAQGLKRLKKLEAAAKTAEKRIQDLSTELLRSQDTVKYYQCLQESQASQIQELAAGRETQQDWKRTEARIQQLEAEIAQIKEEIKNGNYESTQQRATIRKAQEDRCIAQLVGWLRLLEASEKERRDLEKKLVELEGLNRRQVQALNGAAKTWLKKNQEMDVMREELRWRMVDSKSAYSQKRSKRVPASAAAAEAARKLLANAEAAATASISNNSSSSSSSSSAVSRKA